MKGGMLAGGFKAPEAADADIQAVLDSVKAEVGRAIGKDLGDLKALTYKSQVVAGTNYIIEAQIDNEAYHVTIFKPLPHTGAAPEFKSATGPHAQGSL
jgi:cystatin-A/B